MTAFKIFVHMTSYTTKSYAIQGTKKFQYCTCPAGRVTYNFHSSCKHMHLSFKSVCNKEHKGEICNRTSLSNSSQSTRPVGRVLGKNYLSFLDVTRNYEQTSGIFVPCNFLFLFIRPPPPTPTLGKITRSQGQTENF